MEKEKEEQGEIAKKMEDIKAWQSYIMDKFKKTTTKVDEVGTTANANAIIGSIHQHCSSHLRSFQKCRDALLGSCCSLQGAVSETRSNFSTYEDAFFNQCKGGLNVTLQHPTVTAGVTLGALFLLAKGPRRFLLRHTVGRLQSEEARFVKAEKNVKSLNFSVNLMKKESKKLLERATFAEKEMTNGKTNLMNSGKQIQHLTKSVDQVQAQAADLVDLLREIPGRDALRLRAEVASVASLIKQQRTGLAKRTAKLAELGVPV